MKIAVVGGGHVGLVAAACFATVGHDVKVYDIDETKVDKLRDGEVPFLEPGLERLLDSARKAEALTFHSDAAEALPGCALIFLCVNTSNGPDGNVDLSAVASAARAAASFASDGAVIVNRSTSPVGTARYIESIVADRRGRALSVAVNPEFLAEGTAVRDFLFPDRLVFGASEERSVDLLREAYEPILLRRLPTEVLAAARAQAVIDLPPVPMLVMTPQTAELTKYAANAFLSVKISFINEIASIAEELGADVEEVARAVGLDHRIGPHFLRAGIGWGGYCFPKDIAALTGMAQTHGLPARMLRAANEVNEDQRTWAIRVLQRHLKTLFGRRIGLLGLSFKANTDDLRNAPSLEIAFRLAELGAEVRAYDPAVRELSGAIGDIVHVDEDATTVARGADALIIVTEWPEFAQLDLPALRSSMRVPLMIDGRNMIDPQTARDAGFLYVGVGRDADSSQRFTDTGEVPSFRTYGERLEPKTVRPISS